MFGSRLAFLSSIRRSRQGKIILSLLLMVLPTSLVRPLANILGHSIASGARIGLSWVNCDVLVMSSSARIGHLNLLRIRRLVMGPKSQLGNMNICRGPLSLRLGTSAALGNRNTVARAPRGVTFGAAQLWLGRGAKITAAHSLDCARSVRIGEYSILAGKSSQIWSHGYVHDDTGPGRYRVDGSVSVGSNVYIGSGVIITGGVEICDSAIIGVGTCVTKNLTEPAFYVSAPLRMLPKPANPSSRVDLEHVTASELVETVYRKHIAHS